ncbi:MAG: hypothetical protein JWM11_3201 [Planctomycetaceae bacterium]|nr:hypothetical protein [Planctomycetaceae bacterium]
MKIPETLRWKVGKTLGEGGQGVVQSVTDEKGEFPGVFALKQLKGGLKTSAYDRFAREVSAIKSIDHSGIVKIIDHSTAGEKFQFYVMEYFEGAKSLGHLIGKPVNPFHANASKSLDLLIQLIDVIHACESAKIIHRDLSPANVLVLTDGRIKVIDFGLCQIEDGETITLTDEGVGTQNYMAPECESGANQVATWKADLYSVGKIVWSAIANSVAFSRENPAFSTKSMELIFPDKPETWHIQHVFAKMIRHKVEDRFQTTDEALKTAWRVVSLVSGGFPPLKRIAETCPICGWGKCNNFEGSHSVFGNPNPAGIFAIRCDYCGYCAVVDSKVRNGNLAVSKNFT